MAFVHHATKGGAEDQLAKEMAELAERDTERFLTEVDAVLAESALQAARYVAKGGE